MLSSNHVPFHYLSGVRLSLYTPEEIKSLSVKRLTNPATFDALLHPSFGGLYDPALGPTDKDDLCGTCAQNYVHCPGHLGHIELPLTVYHPLFFKLMLRVIRATCFNCHRLFACKSDQHLFQSQMKLLNYGLMTDATKLEGVLLSVVNAMSSGSKQRSLEVEEQGIKAVDDFVKKALRHLDRKEAKLKSNSKTITDTRHVIIKQFMDTHCNTKKRYCAACGAPSREVRSEYNTRVFLKALSSKDARKWAALRVAQLHLEGRQVNDNNTLTDDGQNSSSDPIAPVMPAISVTEESEMNKNTTQMFLTPIEVKEHIIKVWGNDGDFLSELLGGYPTPKAKRRVADTSMFFIDVLPVAPSRFRPVSFLGDKKFENPQTANLNKVLYDCVIVSDCLKELADKTVDGETVENQKATMKVKKGRVSRPVAFGKTPAERLKNAWLKLQNDVNCLMDSDLDKLSTDKFPGVRQILEKKEGLFRKHMMGKRVDYAARSVISPDPYINTDEIGIPEVFAVKLTYPQPVVPWNVKELRQAVINGPLVHPGATLVEHEDGMKTLLNANDPTQREAIAKRLLTPATVGQGPTMSCKKVYRHLKNGDVLLLNRQPTLHKPSIMAHKVRVLPREKTIRLHYSNCKSYNADFDGDEMNAHFPQNELARAEAYNIASTNFQYLVPKDGTPLGGLIQDHMVSGVKMTVRGRMFNRVDYQQLVYSALSYQNQPIILLTPCIIKPHMLWSGKQVISTVLLNLIPEDCKLLNLKGKSKISGRSWCTKKGVSILEGDNMSEAEVIVREGELVCGVLDKGHYGPTPFGLVHCCYELYGGLMAGHLLSSLARLFTAFLQLHGFSLGVEDIVLTSKADKKRKKLISKCRVAGAEAAAAAMSLPEKCERTVLEKRLQQAHHGRDDSDMKELDLNMKKKTDYFNDQINRICMPVGLGKRFPENNLQLMVQSGAKGSLVNCMQISSLLGQIELEGRRPPLMLSGHSLPSFLPYDTSPRAGGFVDGRFLTGIRPQEYFFHCMAGREGLVDTAVKTSRSGYLQRCLIKHLEGLQVNYDLTVRDSDGSVVQFYYGEDGLDIPKTQFLSEKQFPFMASNYMTVLQRIRPKDLVPHLNLEKAEKKEKKIMKWKKKHPQSPCGLKQSPFLSFASRNAQEAQDIKDGDELDQKSHRTKADLKLFEMWNSTPLPARDWYAKKAMRCPDPVLSELRPDTYFGCVSEKLTASVDKYIQCNPDHCLTDDDETDSGKLPASKFRNLIYLKALKALVEPGESVGLLAAQSIGEPSTQMTLNTFHFAGRGEMNVTLGIPRMREILMTASANIKTPTMDVPVLTGHKVLKKAKQLQKKLTKVYLSQVLESADVSESVSKKEQGTRQRVYRIQLRFLPESSFKDELAVTSQSVLQYVENVFIKKLINNIQKNIRVKQTQRLLDSTTEAEGAGAAHDSSAGSNVDDDDDNAELSDEEAADGDAAEIKLRQRREQHASYEAPDEDDRLIDDELGYSDKSEDEDDSQSADLESSYGGDDLESVVSSSHKKHKRSKSVENRRTQRVVESDPQISSYSYDMELEQWCEVKLKFPVLKWKVRVLSLLEKLASQSIVCETPGIKRCFLVEEENKATLKTEGVNLQAAYQYSKIIDVNKLYTNDIHSMATTYGIEAASRVIMKEIANVFDAYHIRVDPRHLSLVADYMTYEGRIKAFNRIGIESNASPFQKMSFETTTHFIRGAVMSGDTEGLTSPSSRLVVGRPVSCGTGSFDLLQPLSIS